MVFWAWWEIGIHATFYSWERREQDPFRESDMIDFSQTHRISEQNVTFRSGKTSGKPRLTVAIPTYKRGHIIRRALTSLANQTFKDFVLIISDDGGDDSTTKAVVEELAHNFQEVVLIAQNHNLGSLENFAFVSGLAETDHFLWLADDDAFSSRYIENLVRAVENDPSIAIARGRWHRMIDPVSYVEFPPQEYPSHSRIARILRYVSFNHDDSFFYGLHRVEFLRKIKFEGFAWPNQGVLTNWCYVFLFDMIWGGRVVFVQDATWYCHNYTAKDYVRAEAFTLTDRMKTFARRVNVYSMFLKRVLQRQPIMLVAVVPAAAFGLIREVLWAAVRILSRNVKRLFEN